MTDFINQLTQNTNKDIREKLIRDYIHKCKKEHKDIIQKYLIWGEYLKRSKSFKEACEWFKNARTKHPYPEEIKKHLLEPQYLEDYAFFVTSYDQVRPPLLPLKTYAVPAVNAMREGIKIFDAAMSGTFFMWALEAGYPSKFQTDMLMNLFVFGDVHKDSVDALILRAIHLIETRNKTRALRFEECIDTIFRHIDEHFESENVPSAEDYKRTVKELLSSDHHMLTICLIDPYENTDKTLDAIKQLINERRDMLKAVGIEKDEFSYFRGFQFEYPMGNLRLDDIKRYLRVYDLIISGKKGSEISPIIHPIHKSDPSDVERMIFRDRQYASKIISNVETGLFPGKYS